MLKVRVLSDEDGASIPGAQSPNVCAFKDRLTQLVWRKYNFLKAAVTFFVLLAKMCDKIIIIT